MKLHLALMFLATMGLQTLKLRQIYTNFVRRLTHNFLVYPIIGVSAKFKHNTNSNIGFEEISRDFNNPFNEICGGILVGPLEISLGKVLDYDFTSLETKYSIFRGDKKGLKNYIQLHEWFNYLYSVNNDKLNQFSVSTGLNYNLDLTENWISKKKNTSLVYTSSKYRIINLIECEFSIY